MGRFNKFTREKTAVKDIVEAQTAPISSIDDDEELE